MFSARLPDISYLETGVCATSIPFVGFASSLTGCLKKIPPVPFAGSACSLPGRLMNICREPFVGYVSSPPGRPWIFSLLGRAPSSSTPNAFIYPSGYNQKQE